MVRVSLLGAWAAVNSLCVCVHIYVGINVHMGLIEQVLSTVLLSLDLLWDWTLPDRLGWLDSKS